MVMLHAIVARRQQQLQSVGSLNKGYSVSIGAVRTKC